MAYGPSGIKRQKNEENLMLGIRGPANGGNCGLDVGQPEQYFVLVFCQLPKCGVLLVFMSLLPHSPSFQLFLKKIELGIIDGWSRNWVKTKHSGSCPLAKSFACGEWRFQQAHRASG